MLFKVEKIKLMADYECYPLWWASYDKAGDIDPKLNWEDPNSSGFPSLEAKAAFEAEGISLWKQLQKELAPNYEVFYFSETLRKVVSDINELDSLRVIYT